MKKQKLFCILVAALAAVMLLTACGNGVADTPVVAADAVTDGNVTAPEGSGSERTFVDVVDFYGNVVTVVQNPTTVAIFDFGILDMLYNIGFENTGIETLIVPTMSTLPDSLAWFRDGGDENTTVVTGGTLFYIDWDILDFVNPELVVLGVRSFGMNAAEERLSPDAALEFQHDTFARYQNTAFMWLTIDARNANLTRDMRANAYSLAQIFPGIGELLFSEIEEIEAEFAAIREVTTASGMEAAFIMMLDPATMTVFLDNSRFGFLFDEFGFAPLTLDLEAWTDQHGFAIQSEFLLENNPDVIFLLDRTDPDTGLGAATDNFMNDAIIQRTNAFINGHIYSGLPMPDWYTIVGGFGSARRMIQDVNRFVDHFLESAKN
ncbi:MAG: ABC transporter substrate-binding protein [Oscillospiraceae bacterium]|nr:ABC transporter substrate-binding protein [Oscillospiraceae bacterium]